MSFEKFEKRLNDIGHDIRKRFQRNDLDARLAATPRTELLRGIDIAGMYHLMIANPYIMDVLLGKPPQYMKANDPYLTTTVGVWQPLYGMIYFRQPHLDPTFFKAIPKVPWLYDGVRVLTADPTNKITGIGEEDSYPDTDKPDYELYKTDTKWMATRWDISAKVAHKALVNEGINMRLEMIEDRGRSHAAGMNELLLVDASAEAAAAGADRTTTDMYDVESIDRIISSDSEEDAFGGTHDHWFDPYGTTVDRDTGTTFDSVVLHNSGTDRPLTTDLMDELIRKCEDLGADKKYSFLLTNRETRDKLSMLALAQLRYKPGVTDKELKGLLNVSFDFEGVKVEGHHTGMQVASYKGYPIIVDKNVPVDGTGRIYLIDGRYLRFKTAMPTNFLEMSGPQAWIKFRKNVNKYMFLTVGELECVNFACQGKLRDLA